MARANRVLVSDGIYHVTSRIVNREMWLHDPRLKDEIVSWMYGIAAFSGVELLAWCIMDNHFHILVHVPKVPVRYRLDPDRDPPAYALGMRPSMCRPPLWRPDEPSGDCPPGKEFPQTEIRPPTGFMLPDDEMLERLRHLYGDENRIEALRVAWEHMRRVGNDAAVDAVKEGYCRRMYNLSQFVKALKERIARTINSRLKHVGHVFEGRFHSGLVEKIGDVEKLVALYIDGNPYRARLVSGEKVYRWSSFGRACDEDGIALSCRKVYEHLHSRPWTEVKAKIFALFGGSSPRRCVGGESTFGFPQNSDDQLKVPPSELIRTRITALSDGAFIGKSMAFGHAIASSLAQNFPCPSFRTLVWLERNVKWQNDRSVA